MIDYKGYKIQIEQDDDVPNPRKNYDHLGTMVCEHRRYDLGDGGFYLLIEDLAEETKYTEYGDMPDDKSDVLALAEKNSYVVLPLYLHDHSGITMSTTPFSCPWDSGQVGFIFCSKRKRLAEGMTQEQTAEALRAEVAEYDQYISGDVWYYTIEDSNGEMIDSLGGLYGHDYAERTAKEFIYSYGDAK